MAITNRYQVELLQDSFSRLDTTADLQYYEHSTDPGFDESSAGRVQQLTGDLITDTDGSLVILDLMAGSDSYLPAELAPAQVVGIGPCRSDMERNPALGERIVQDLESDPRLPFTDQHFDVVLCTAAIPYLARPFELCAEAARVLKPGGLLLVIFDNRFVKERVVKVWRRFSEEERLNLVNHYLERSGGFEEALVRVSKARLASDDSSEHTTRPLYALIARRSGGAAEGVLPLQRHSAPLFSPEEIRRRKQQIGETMRCPHCDVPLTRVKVPDVPFCEWDAEYVWVCFAEHCPFTVRSLEVMREQGNQGVAYRLMYHRERDRLYTVPDVGFCDAG